jgi:5-methylthioadenosine/S-adenosylhomocysteine deaminase
MLGRSLRRAAVLLAMGLSGCMYSSNDASDTSHPLPLTTSGGPGSSSSGMGGAMPTTSSSSGPGSGGGMCTGDEPTIESTASKTKVLLKGTILTPSGPIDGQLLISGNTIACVDVDCSAQASNAAVVDTHGVVSPGLIDAHNHILFDIFDEDDWSPIKIYANHTEWPSDPQDPKYGALVDAKQYLDGETSTVDYGCEMDKFGEMKGLIAGTTSIQGSPGATSRACYGSLARSIDISYNDLSSDKMQTATVFPSTSSADGVCANFASGNTTAYVVHIAEGTDTTAHNEFSKLFTVSTTDGCLYDPHTTIIHGTALNDADFATMAMHQMSLAWSPRSNVFLYGGGTDVTKTTDISLALSHGINVAIAPDWSIGGSQNMLDEMRYANYVDDNRFGNMLSSEDIWRMATANAARALGLSNDIGSLVVGARADIAVFAGSTAAPFDTILASTPREVSMVFVDGRLLYGDAAVEPLGPDNATCETLDVCCRPKVACIAETNGAAADKLDQTLSTIEQSLDSALSSYDALNITQWKFAPLTPLVKCN